ncbi:transposase [Acidiphilium sp. AL]|uniref:transposase n=1 Tax=Acidiphilium sp. AL TaxID=2871704 RepID=UPI0021CB05D8|nr:transposase [Acidiphilium sp. AL]MCU4158872.1 transposase [Acidiphilium sp. AL]
MKKSRFSEEQIIRCPEGAPGEDSHCGAMPQAQISDATFYNWRNRYGVTEVSGARRLKSLEEENRKLKVPLHKIADGRPQNCRACACIGMRTSNGGRSWTKRQLVCLAQ